MISDNIRLALTGLDPAIAIELLEIFGSVSKLFSVSLEEILARSRFKEKDVRKLFNLIDDKRILEEEKFINQYSIDSYIFGEEKYPLTLSSIRDAAPILFSKGPLDLSEANEKWIAVVGTRKCSSYGVASTERIIADLAANYDDVVIVSGLAYGIDACAHRAAIKYGLRTVAVVAHGLDSIYPSDHRDLARQIIDTGGAIITEHPSQTIITRYSFLRRNRIIAGISSGLILAESPEKGGSMFTANLADEYGRDLFAFPARTIDKSFTGNLKLLRERKANLLFDINDIADEMAWGESKKSNEFSFFNSVILSDNEEEVYNLFVDNNCYSADELMQRSTLPPVKVFSVLTSLEFKGLIRSVKGKMYMKI